MTTQIIAHGIDYLRKLGIKCPECSSERFLRSHIEDNAYNMICKNCFCLWQDNITERLENDN